VIVETFPTRAAWLAARRNPHAIGASEAAVALGVSPYSDPWALWERKVGRGEDDRTPEDVEALTRGNRWEPAVLAEYEDASGGRVVEPGAHFGQRGHLVTLSNEAFPWLRSSPDAFAVDRWGVLGHVEAKTALDGDAWTDDRGVIIDHWTDGSETLVPAHYAVQAYVQLAVTGMPWNDLCALVPHRGWLAVRWVRLMRDEATQNALIEALAAWRSRHLVGGEPPPVDGSRACSRHLARLLDPPKKRPSRAATSEEAVSMRELAMLRARMKRDEERARLLGNELAAAAGADRITLDGEGKTPFGQAQSTGGRVTIDAAKLKAEFPDAYAACSRTSAESVTFAMYNLKEPTNDDQSDE